MTNLIINDKYFNLGVDSRFSLAVPTEGWQSFSSREFITPDNLSIYLLKCNGKYYVGSDRDGCRPFDHDQDFRGGYHGNSYMQNLFNKYGHESFFYCLLIEIPEEYRIYRDQIENSYIKLFNTFVGKNKDGLNLVEFADTPWLGRTISEQSKKKISESKLGKPRSQETKNKISQSHTGKKLSEEHKQKLSEIRLAMNRKLTDEHRKKLSIANSGKIYSQETLDKIGASNAKKTYELINPNGELIVINNMRKFCRENNLEITSLRKVFYGKLNCYRGWKSVVSKLI